MLYVYRCNQKGGIDVIVYRPCTERKFTAHMEQNVQHREHSKISRVRIKVLSGVVALCLSLANGGFTLNPSAPSSRTFQHLDMVSRTQGWAWSRAQVWITTDGGVQWRTVTPTFQKAAAPNGLVSFTPISSSSAVVTWELTASGESTVVTVTTDDGQHWHDTGTVPRMLSPWGMSGNATDLQWTSVTQGWAIQLGTGTASGTESYWLWATDDAGRMWHRVHAWNYGLPVGWIDFHTANQALMTTGEAIAPVTVFSRLIQAGVVQQPIVWPGPITPHTDLEVPFASNLATPSAFWTDQGWVVPVLNADWPHPLLGVLHLGVHSQWVHPPTRPTGRFRQALTHFTQSTFEFCGAQHGWFIPDGGFGHTLWRTANGGQTWVPVNRNTRWTHLEQLDFVTARQGWAMTQSLAYGSTLWHTSDAGQHWKAMRTIIR